MPDDEDANLLDQLRREDTEVAWGGPDGLFQRAANEIEELNARLREADAPPISLARLKDRIDMRMSDYLCDMKPDYDDSITGFNEAWNIVRDAFAEVCK